ncbi:MAG: hypothetical protein AAB348_01590 [Patescibacteria group bacterium]
MSKKILFILALFAILIPVITLAAYGLEDAAKDTGIIDSPSASIPDLVGKIVGIALSFLGIIFFLLILYAGFTWMTAFGNAEKINKAKDIMEAAVLGLLIVLAAYAVTRFVFSSLNVGGSGESMSTQVTPVASPVAGQLCGDRNNRVWSAGGVCTTECKYQFPRGECLDTRSFDCIEEFKEGLCPGEDNIKCCPLK